MGWNPASRSVSVQNAYRKVRETSLVKGSRSLLRVVGASWRAALKRTSERVMCLGLMRQRMLLAKR